MKILFVMRSTVYVRNFESMLRQAARRGHHVHVVAESHHLLDPTNLIARLASEWPTITYSAPPSREPNGWTLLGTALRRGIDYLRYLGPEYRDAPKLRGRAERAAPEFVKTLLGWPVFASAAGRDRLAAWLRYCDRCMPRDAITDALVAQHAPDLLLVTPLVEPGSPQSEYIRCAQARGIRTGLCVYSWDNLTNKGLIQDPLDVITVWNEPMREEAVTLHRVAPERVVVTGSPAYDHWFEWGPARDRATFCAAVGLPGDRPYVLYLCSSKFIAPDEVPSVRRWIEALRRSSGPLRDAGVLVRPHPQNPARWREADLSDLGSVSIWPPAGRNPVDTDSRSEYFDSIYHSAAVVGVNTSAQIESAIVGRPVYTVLLSEFRETQEGTLHFRHLREAGGGLLHVAADLDEHVAQLERALAVPPDRARLDGFLKTFIRPFGLDRPATPLLLDALEGALQRPRVEPMRTPASAWITRRLLGRVAVSYAREERARVEAESRKAEERRRRAEAAAAKREAGDRSKREKRERALRREAEQEAESRQPGLQISGASSRSGSAGSETI